MCSLMGGGVRGTSTPRGYDQLNKCEPTNLPAHKQWAKPTVSLLGGGVLLGVGVSSRGGSVCGVKKVWGGGNPLGAGGSSGSSSVCLGPTCSAHLCWHQAGGLVIQWSAEVALVWAPSRKAFLTPVHSTPSQAGALGIPNPLSSPSPWAPGARPAPAAATLGLVWPLGYPCQWPLVCTAAAFLAMATENPLGPAATILGPPGCQHHPSLSQDRSSQRDQSPRPCLPFTSPGSLFLMPTALQPLALCLAPETSWRAPKRKEAGPGAPVPGRVCWGPGCCGGASGCGCHVGSMVQGCCSCWAFILLNGGAGVSLGLQAPVRGVEEEHQEAAEEDAEAGHQQHGHWGDTAQLCLRRPKRLGTHPGAGDPRATSGIDPRPGPRGKFSEPGAVSPKVTPPGLRTWVCNTIPLLSLAFCLHLCLSLRLLLCLSCL